MNAEVPDGGNISRWLIGLPATRSNNGECGIALATADLPTVTHTKDLWIGFHQAMHWPGLPRAKFIYVRLPAYRGKALLNVLNWLVTERLAVSDSVVTWMLEKQQGPDSCAHVLASLGWRNMQKTRDGKLYHITASPPLMAEFPAIHSFTTTIGSRELTFAADYGVFCPAQVDDGTRLLSEAALRHPPVDVVADIGVRYGPLAIAPVSNGLARRALATDVDCIAFWLAERNAVDNGLPLQVISTPDSLALEDTPLTVCNVPTHIDRTQSADLMGGLAERAREGRVLMIVVHTSLESRYSRHLTAAGLKVSRHSGDSHVVLTASG